VNAAASVERRARTTAVPLVLGGVVCGLAWAAALRVVMATTAGVESTVEWLGTFEGILLPGAVTGGLLGWAEHLRRTGGHPRRRWLVLAPLTFVLATPGVVPSVFVDGLGGGAIGVPLIGMAGGYALAGSGPRWARWAAGGLALLAVPGWLVTASLIGGELALGTPRGAWTAVLYLSLLAVLCLGCAVPLRGPGETDRAGLRLVVAGVVCGLAWGAGLRGFMAEIAEPTSSVSWIGTFGAILLPAAVVGGLLGWAEHRRRTGGSARWRRLALAPLVFAVDPFALVVVLPAMAGGYALSGRASRRARWVCGAAAFLPVPVFVLVVALLGDRGALGELATPQGAWTTTLLFSCLAVLTISCAIPRRPVVPASPAEEMTPPPVPSRPTV
jgi:hypothetical protein